MKTIKYVRIAGAVLVFFVTVISFSPGAGGSEPAPPTGLTAIVGNGEASLTWGAVPASTSYALYRGTTNGGPYSFTAQTQGTGYTDRGITNGSPYYYVVTALNADGQSPNSAQVSVTPTAVLKAPMNLAAIHGNGQVSLVWDPVQSAVSYNVYRAASKGGPYTLLTPSALGPSFTDTGLTNGTPYYYVVQTLSQDVGAYSDEVSATPSALVPAAPVNLTVTPGSTWASLSWSSSAGATGYAVYRGTVTGGPYSFAALSSSTAYEDTGLTDGTVYYYVVAAVNANGRGAFSPEANASVSAIQRPHAPVLSAKKTADGQVTLYWDSAPGAVSYTIHRSTVSGESYDTLPAVNPSGYYVDQGLQNGTTYYYVVDAHNGSTTDARSNEVGITPVAQVPPPANVAVIPGNTQATVTWTPVPGIPLYWVSVSDSLGGQSVTGGYSQGASFTATGLTNGVSYDVKVQSGSDAAGAAFWSSYSEASFTPSEALPLAPINFYVASGGNTQLTIRWDDVAGAIGYNVYRRTEGSAWPSTPIATLAGTLFTDTGLANGTEYHYIVDAINGNGEGAWASSEMIAKPAARATLAPTNMAVIPGNMQATVTWNPVVGATDYWITVATSPGGQYVTGGYSGGAPSFTATGLTNGTPYYFSVQSIGGPSNSAYSAEVSVTPSVALPLAPINFGLTSGGNTQLSIRWDDVPGATGYNVYRRTEENSWPSTPVGTVVGTRFSATGLTNGKKYYYAVAAINVNGQGAWAVNQVYGMPVANATLAPTNVAVIPGNTEATVTWNPVVGATDYWITVATSPGGQYLTGGYSGGAPSFTATGLINGTPYYFSVQSIGGPSNSAYSAEVAVAPSVALPFAPINFHLTLAGNTQLSIRWDAVTSATSYRVYRRTEGSPWPSAPVGTPAGTLFTDTGLTNGTRYYYIVAAVNANGPGAWAVNQVYGTPTADAKPAPTNVAVVAGNTLATVTWDPVVGATGYYVVVATSPGGEASTSSGGASGTSYTATGLNNSQTYYFRVQVSSPTASAYSAEVSATTSSPPADQGTISGRVSVNFAGYSDLGVREATVALDGTAYSTTTDTNGNFSLPTIPFGTYTLVVTAPNLDTVTQAVSLTAQDLAVAIPPMAISQASCLKGDANGDGLVGLEDVIYILQILTGVREP